MDLSKEEGKLTRTIRRTHTQLRQKRWVVPWRKLALIKQTWYPKQ